MKINEEFKTIRDYPIENIKIPMAFKQTSPSELKLDKVRNYFYLYGKFDKPILIDDDGYLIDGYTRYLIALEKNLSFVEVVVRLSAYCALEENYETDKEKYNKMYKEHLDNGEFEYIIGIFNNKLIPKRCIWINRKGLFIDIGDIIKVKSMINGSVRNTPVIVLEKFWSNTEPKRRSVTSIIKKENKG